MSLRDFIDPDVREQYLDLMKGFGIPCTPKQRGYIYGLCKKLGYDPHNLPEYICIVSETRDMDIEQAANTIEALRDELGLF